MPVEPAMWNELARAGIGPERLFRLLAENSAELFLFGRADGTVLWISESVRSVLGWEPEEVVGGRMADLLHPDDLAGLRARVDAMRADVPEQMEARVATSDGDFRWMSARVTNVSDGEGEVRWRVGAWRDVDDQHRAVDALALSEERFRAAMTAAPIGMAVVDLDRRFLAVNPALCEMLGRDEGWLLAHRVADLLDPVDNEADLRVRAELLHQGNPTASVEKRLLRADGTALWAQHVVGVLRDADGVPSGYVSQWLDITDHVLVRDRLQFQATHDPLTQVGNREDLDRRLRDIARRSSPGRTGILFVDLDHLKQINDTHGHTVGDQVLVQVARRLGHAVRRDDLVVRFGGDEFVVILSDVASVADVRAVAENVVRAMRDPVTLDDVAIHVSVSVGATLTDPGEDPRRVLHHADTALYDAKRGGRGRVALRLR